MKQGEKEEVVRAIYEGDRTQARKKILLNILRSQGQRSFFSRMARELDLSRQTILTHLLYLVEKEIVTTKIEIMYLGEETRPVAVKWCSINDKVDKEWLTEILTKSE